MGYILDWKTRSVCKYSRKYAIKPHHCHSNVHETSRPCNWTRFRSFPTSRKVESCLKLVFKPSPNKWTYITFAREIISFSFFKHRSFESKRDTSETCGSYYGGSGGIYIGHCITTKIHTLISMMYRSCSAIRLPVHILEPWPKGRIRYGSMFSHSASPLSHLSGLNFSGEGKYSSMRPAMQWILTMVWYRKTKYNYLSIIFFIGMFCNIILFSSFLLLQLLIFYILFYSVFLEVNLSVVFA